MIKEHKPTAKKVSAALINLGIKFRFDPGKLHTNLVLTAKPFKGITITITGEYSFGLGFNHTNGQTVDHFKMTPASIQNFIKSQTSKY